MNSSLDPYGVMVKARRSNFVRLYAVNLKPPEPELDKSGQNRHKFWVRFVTAQGHEKKVRCTPEVFDRVRGRAREKAAHTGLDMRLNTHFVLLQRRADPDQDSPSLIEQIDVYSMRTNPQAFALADEPEDAPLIVKVNVVTGELEVLARPSNITEPMVNKLFEALDNRSEIRVGDNINGFVVNGVGADRVSFETAEAEVHHSTTEDPFAVPS